MWSRDPATWSWEDGNTIIRFGVSDAESVNYFVAVYRKFHYRGDFGSYVKTELESNQIFSTPEACYQKFLDITDGEAIKAKQRLEAEAKLEAVRLKLLSLNSFMELKTRLRAR